MRLTLHTDYALRLLLLLGSEPNHLHTIEEVAKRYSISRNHLMKVTQTLAQGGFIESLRGRNGGLRLASAADRINIGDVVRCTEDNFYLVECFDRSNNNCVITNACKLRGILREAMQSFMAVLDRYTLADLLASATIRNTISRILLAE